MGNIDAIRKRNEDNKIERFLCDTQDLSDSFERNYDLVVQAYISYYHNRARQCKRWFYIWNVLKLFLVALLPILQAAGVIEAYGWLVSAFSSGILFIESIVELWRFREKWILYRSTCNTLLSIQRIYSGKRGNMEGEMGSYVEAVEAVISEEAKEWVANARKAESDSNGKDKKGGQ